MGLRLQDYACECGKHYRDWPIMKGKIPETIKCECGKRATWARMKVRGIHRSISTMYGKLDPRFGVVVESYEHKKQLLKEHGWEETDVERYDDIQNDVEAQEAKKKSKGEYIAADSLDEVYEQIEKQSERISWKDTGNLRGRTDQDPVTGLIDSMGGF